MLTDSFGCLIQWSLPLDEPDSITFQAVLNPASDSLVADGGILLDLVSGGTAPYDILWSNGAVGLLADALLPGPYVVTITDANGCSRVAGFVVDFVVGTQQAEAAGSGVAVFPNPFTESFQIVLRWQPGRGPQPCQFTLTNALGMTVGTMTLKPGQTLVRAPALPAGVYFWQVGQVGRLWRAGRLVKQ